MSKKHQSIKHRRAKKQLSIVQQSNAQSIQFFEMLNFMNRENLENVIDDNVDFDDILVSHSTIARHMGRKN